MLINLSNHPYVTWSDEQKVAASKQFGRCVDMPFPAIDPMGNESYINQLSETYRRRINEQVVKRADEVVAVHLMGELTFVFSLLQKLQRDNIRCVASTTTRKSIERGDGTKESQFVFSRFRNYFFSKNE